MSLALEAAWLALLILGIGSLIFGIISWADGLRFLRRVAKSLEIKGSYQPPAVILIPVRGKDPYFEETLEALKDQEYPAYRLIFITDPGDIAAEHLSAHAESEEVTVVQSERLDGCSGKIAALLTGLEHVEESDDVVIFADSDIGPDSRWLSSLVAPLADPSVGASTGYRWYFPTRDGLGPSLHSAWNSAGANVLFDQRWTYLWGGSYAIRRTTLQALGIEERWRRSLSDDMVMTQTLKEKGYRIVFSPRATVANYTNYTLKDTVKWTNRQAVLALLYAPAMRRLTIPYAIYTGSLMLAFASIGLVALSFSFLLPTLLLSAPVYLGLLKSLARRAAFRTAMPAFRRHFSRHRGWFYLSTVLLPILMLLNVRRAARMREFEWRGKVYTFTSPVDISVSED